MRDSLGKAKTGSACRAAEYFDEEEGRGWWTSLGVLVVWLACAMGAMAQGFAGLGEQTHGFSEVVSGKRFDFPADHGPHEDFRIEWWYVTANLQDEDGQDYGVQWTLFRQAMRPDQGTGWASNQLWMGHAALTTSERHFVAEKFARGGIGQAGVVDEPFEAWIDDWAIAGSFDDLSLAAGNGEFAYDLALRTDAPIVLQGNNGVSVKSETGQASYYYSQPFYQIEGQIVIDGEAIAVRGQAWLDREWSTQPLAGDQAGWDWVSLHLEDGTKVMLFRLRHKDGSSFYSGTWIEADGTSEALPDGIIALVPLEIHETAGVMLPVRWQIEVPSRGLAVEIEAVNQDAYMATRFPYWEGPVRVTGSHKGVGYLEMTGYGAK